MARILVVDDEPEILAMLKRLLTAEGYSVTDAMGGEKAKAVLETAEFDLMISDIRMAPVDGMQLLEFAHAKYPSMSVIMLTAFGQVDTALKALELGAFDYVKKPFSAETLLSTIRKALECHEYMEQSDAEERQA